MFDSGFLNKMSFSISSGAKAIYVTILQGCREITPFPLRRAVLGGWGR
jgi:hypothetical protein